MRNQDNEIVAELRKIEKLLVILGLRTEPKREQIRVLSLVGFQPKEIAQFVGSTPNAVSVALATLRRPDRQDAAPTSAEDGQPQ